MLEKRANYTQVGDYLYSQDLCVGVFDGTDFNSGTCEKSKLTAQDNGHIAANTIIIRYNQIEPQISYLASVLQNLTTETQAQCVMTSTNTTACWVWNDDFSQCLDRCYYKTTTFERADGWCKRTSPVENAYAIYVRRSDFDQPSAASLRIGLKPMVLLLIVLLGIFIQ
ncbi:hypothetical protein H4R99_000849 [Coemansia sp. RSA 1722]|nr:hypothetical protein IWW45_004702 [Coemansia sp. RSA 485]KAJ2605845.1 hypothetical protein H4R99_000849 [Coemansia sp. RSA 1722]KAJ2638913.1 hypothetical protein GGF40_001316 [Coemansia sp. RSA 1286]